VSFKAKSSVRQTLPGEVCYNSGMCRPSESPLRAPRRKPFTSMNPWRPLLRNLEDELERLSQEVRGRRVLPNSIELTLPGTEFETFAPVLAEVTAEVGEKLTEWANQRRRTWYADAGPYLAVHIDSCAKPQIECHFRKKSEPAGRGADTREEPAVTPGDK
jgi:hypothetical protein